ncbi:hypothetical protein ASPSYDRAFT_295167 [Aspergillus sydowii CBS 593.65]|uniref:Uncharacterized protein n=1 Tax=Aspergillus sydowii CBS 593.65 TaxID=1036612 RepID=A0A1L9TXT0_9EURO|nr:uncharacterized protein ASPSYDRAFT_295167 [Aspergillus sydowii CBS 593.65]OJJ64205.1 hypothetical protein ASPSYDRAFT_295167 [Aspergillus sydowii CBS 593.65]
MSSALRPSIRSTPSRQFVDYVLLWQLNLRTWFIVSARSTVYSLGFSLYPAILLWRFYAGNWPPPGHLDDRAAWRSCSSANLEHTSAPRLMAEIRSTRVIAGIILGFLYLAIYSYHYEVHSLVRILPC